MSVLSLFFYANELGRMRTLFFPSGSSANPTPARAIAQIVRMGGWMGGVMVISRILQFCQIHLIVLRLVVDLSLQSSGHRFQVVD